MRLWSLDESMETSVKCIFLQSIRLSPEGSVRCISCIHARAYAYRVTSAISVRQIEYSYTDTRKRYH